MKHQAVVCIIRNEKGEFLLQKKTLDYPRDNGGKWYLFGGGLKEGESPKIAMARELKEEIGFCPEVEFVFEMDFEHVNEKHHVFVAEIDNPSKISLGEGAGFAFFSKEELEKYNLMEDARVVLDKFFEENQNAKK